MKQLFTFLFFALGNFLFAQSNFTVFNNGGQQFYVILNGIKQNSVPQTNVSVAGVKNGGYSVKLIFADGKTADIDKNFMIDSPMDITTKVTFKKGKGKIQLVSMEPTHGATTSGAVVYRPDNNVLYSDAPAVNSQPSAPIQTTTTISTNQTVPNGQMNVQSNQTQTNMNNSNQNMNGNVNTNVGINGTTSTNGQNGSVNMNTNIGSNGMNVSVNDPISGENINMNLNVGFNTNGTTTTVSDPLMNGNINMNVDVNGLPISNSTSTSTVTTTSSQTINGQTTYESGSTTTQNNNGNVTVTTTGTPNMNGNVSTNTTQNTTSPTSAQSSTSGNFINCTLTLLNAEEFITDLKSQTFEDDRIDIIYKDLVKTCLTAAQVYKILELITFESSKYEVAQFLYFRTTDRQILDKGMLPLFTFDSTKMDWREFVRENE